MQVTFNDSEIRDAVNSYVRNRLKLDLNEIVTIEFISTRGADGAIKAIVDITTPPTQTETRPKAQVIPKGQHVPDEIEKSEPDIEVITPQEIFHNSTKSKTETANVPSTDAPRVSLFNQLKTPKL